VDTAPILFAVITFLSPIGALTAFYAIHETNPDIVINAGTAGGFKRVGASIGDAFITTSCSHHDRRIPIPGFTEYGKGDHASIPCKNLVEVQQLLRCSFPILSIEFYGVHATSDAWLQVRCVHDRKLSGPLRHGERLMASQYRRQGLQICVMAHHCQCAVLCPPRRFRLIDCLHLITPANRTTS
jgi:hypothetical protein